MPKYRAKSQHTVLSNAPENIEALRAWGIDVDNPTGPVAYGNMMVVRSDSGMIVAIITAADFEATYEAALPAVVGPLPTP